MYMEWSTQRQMLHLSQEASQYKHTVEMLARRGVKKGQTYARILLMAAKITCLKYNLQISLNIKGVHVYTV